MQKLCCVRTRQHPLPVWSHKFVLSSTTHISTNSHPFLVGIVSYQHDLNNAAGQKKRQGLISQQVDSFDESDHDPREYTPLHQDEDDSSPY